MILRQLCARNGRSTALNSSRPYLRPYASSTLDRINSSSTTERLHRQNVTSNAYTESRILESIPQALTGQSSAIEDSATTIKSSAQSLELNINSHNSARILSLPEDASNSESHQGSSQRNFEDPKHLRPSREPPAAISPPFENLNAYYRAKRLRDHASRTGTRTINTYDPLTLLRSPPSAAQLTLPMLLAHQTHLGHATSLWHPGNSSYIFGIRDGVHIIALDTTFAFLRRAAKVVREVARRGGIVLFLGTRKGQEDIVVSSAKMAQAYHIFDRWTPGSLTNGQQILGNCAVQVVDIYDREVEQYSAQMEGDRPVLRPDLVICLNPIENEVCLHECGIYNIPTIGVVDTDCNPAWVTYPIPANDDSMRSIALIAGVLGRAGQEGQRLRLETAKTEGRATYGTESVTEYIRQVEEVQAMDVNEGDNDSEKDL